MRTQERELTRVTFRFLFYRTLSIVTNISQVFPFLKVVKQSYNSVLLQTDDKSHNER